MKKVSVILATYNGEKTIEKTIQSILNQKGNGEEFEIELIVIDDCSTDNTVKVVKQFNVIVLSTLVNSGGPNTGRNIGLKHLTGDYICIADQDDSWNENRIISQLPYFKETSIVSSGYTVIDINEDREMKRVNENPNGFINYSKNATFISKLTKSLKGQNIYLGGIMYSSKLKHILFEEHFGMVDFDWVIRLFYNQDSIEICGSLYTRYVEGANLSLNEDYRRKDFYYSLLTIEKYQDEYPREVITGYKKIHGSRARYYYLIGDMKKARFYFRKGPRNMKTLLYYLTTFVGSKYVKRKFNIFG